METFHYFHGQQSDSLEVSDATSFEFIALGL